MSGRRDRLLVVQVAGLGWDFLVKRGSPSLAGLTFAPARAEYPALTCVAQAGFRTAGQPAAHGMVANGLFDRRLRRVHFWEQSCALVDGARIWDSRSRSGRRVALLFWQQSLGESVDYILSPAPIHPHHGRLIPAVYSKPDNLYERICETVGRPFDLEQYWGPMASPRSSAWIAEATVALMDNEVAAPDLCLTYLPALDYDLQRYGPDDRRAAAAFACLCEQLRTLREGAERCGYEMLVFGDYAIAPCPRGPVHPNRVLARAGLLTTREVRGMRYLDLHGSRAFAVVDHEIAHVYVQCPSDLPSVRRALESEAGVGVVWNRADQARMGLWHAASGDLLIEASDGHWFAYDWWEREAEAPDFAAHVDIHNKPGYDPCELFLGWPPWRVSRDASRIRGSHGRTGAGRDVALACTFTATAPQSLLDAARAVATWLHERT